MPFVLQHLNMAGSFGRSECLAAWPRRNAAQVVLPWTSLPVNLPLHRPATATALRGVDAHR